MGISISGTTLTFNDATTMTTAATAPSTAFGGIGSYAILLNTTTSSLATGSTVAGSALRYDITTGAASNGSTNASTGSGQGNGANPTATTRRSTTNSGYDGGGTAVSGTWRKMSPGSTFDSFTDGCGNVGRYWYFNLYVRIS